MKPLLDPNLIKSEGDRWRCKALLQSRADQNGGKFERRRNAENIGSFSPIVAAATDQKCGACWSLKGGIKSASRWQAGIKVKQQSITFAVTLKRWHQGGTSKYYFKKMASRWSSKVLSLLLLLKRWHQGETAKYYFKKVASRWNSKMKGGIKVASRYYF